MSFNLLHKQFNHIKGYITGIVNGYQLLCDAHTVLEPHRGTAAFSILLAIVLIHFFYVFITLTVLFLFLGASLVCVNNL